MNEKDKKFVEDELKAARLLQEPRRELLCRIILELEAELHKTHGLCPHELAKMKLEAEIENAPWVYGDCIGGNPTRWIKADGELLAYQTHRAKLVRIERLEGK